MGTGDDLRSNELAEISHGVLPRLQSRCHGGNIAFDDNSNIGRSDLFFRDQFDVSRLEHGVRCIEDGGESLRFKDSDGLGFHRFGIREREEKFPSAIERVDGPVAGADAGEFGRRNIQNTGTGNSASQKFDPVVRSLKCTFQRTRIAGEP